MRPQEYDEAQRRSILAALGILLLAADGKTVYVENPNDTAFKVGGIPQINLVDRKGHIRLIMVGYDDANEPKLAGFIEKLLAEK